jgi:hypothetical protein
VLFKKPALVTQMTLDPTGLWLIEDRTAAVPRLAVVWSRHYCRFTKSPDSSNSSRSTTQTLVFRTSRRVRRNPHVCARHL